MRLASRAVILGMLAAAACARSDTAALDQGGPDDSASAPDRDAEPPTSPEDDPSDPSDPPYRECQKKGVVALEGGVTVVVDLPCQPFDPKLQAPDPPF